MSRRYYSSVAQATALAAAIDSNTTTLSVTALSGYPGGVPFTAVIDRGTDNEELVTVTAVSGTTLTVTRGSDGTTAVPHDLNATVEHVSSARDFDEPNAHVNASQAVHGLAVGSDVVGTTDAQALTNKTIDGASNTLKNVPVGEITGVNGDVVGTAAAQTLTNKTIDGALNTLENVPSAALSGPIASGLLTSVPAGSLTGKVPDPALDNTAPNNVHLQGTTLIDILKMMGTQITALDFGTGQYNFNSSGNVTIVHALGKTPIAVFLSTGNVFNVYASNTFTASHFTITAVKLETGAAITGLANVAWLAIA